MIQRYWLLAGRAAMVVTLFPGAAHACAVCLAGVSPDDPLTDAFNWSVLFLMAMPYAVVGSIAGWLFYTYRCKAKKLSGPRKKATILHLAWTHKESGR
jgi:hypothetical protein